MTLRVLIALSLLTLGAKVEAQTQQCGGSANLTWQAPTLNTNGTPLVDLASYRIYWGQTQGTYPNSRNHTTLTALSAVVSNLCAGTWYFVVTSLNSLGIESSFSNVATKTVSGTTNVPGAPTAPAPVTVGGLAYALLITRDASFSAEVGSVPAGVPCDATQQWSVNGVNLMLVPRARVTPLAGVQIEAAWASCR